MLDINKYCTPEDTKRTWVVPKWEHWDELIALLRLLGCREKVAWGTLCLYTSEADLLVYRDYADGKIDKAIQRANLEKLFEQINGRTEGNHD